MSAARRGGGEGLPYFAVAAPGLEGVVAEELRSLGLDAAPEAGGAAFGGGLHALYECNLRSRTASRILVRVARFRATAFFELEKRARRLEWGRFLAPGRGVEFRVSSHASKLYHQGAIAERLLEAAVRAGAVPAVNPTAAAAPDDTEGEAVQLFVVRVVHDVFTVSADASGALLHRRGYRQALAKAPLRETLAAAMLLATGWDRRAPLLDPFCGSGTIPLEAALLVRSIAPGLANRALEPRAYAFQEWPVFDAALWDRIVAEARGRVIPRAAAPIVASDRDAGAITATLANAERAGVRADLEAGVRPLSALAAPPGPGWLVTNPPYGRRVGEREALRDLYAALGRVARERLAGWTVTLLSADRRLDAQTRLPLEEILRTRNGSIPVRLLRAVVPKIIKQADYP